jgi:hypothetical protein
VSGEFRILTMGDSVMWGQGLLPSEKLDYLVKRSLESAYRAHVSLESLAHSGAVIGEHGASGTPEPGEVPAARLSIIEQCDGFCESPETINLVLMNGGMNDVGVSTILNPSAPPLDQAIVSACHDGMLSLLEKVCEKFSGSNCKIVVAGYYPILSPKSHPLGTIKLLSIYSIRRPEFIVDDADFINPVVGRCEQFFRQSNAQLQRAVADAADARIRFVPSGFSDDNSVFVPGTSLLWGLDLDGMKPQDPVAAQRRPLCDMAHPGALELPSRELCYRASAGHPNVRGAEQFSVQILKEFP